MTEPTVASIIGLYKSGTSWLLSALCHHPQVVGIREFDAVRAITGNPRDVPALNEQSDLLTNFFCRSPWCKVPQKLLERTIDLPAEEAVDIWAKQQGKQWAHKSKLDKPQTFFDLDREVAIGFYKAVKEASSKEELSAQFVDTLATYSSDAKYSLLKAADQVAVFDRLKTLIPNTKHILIIRDGRDASISAFHYRQLMKENNAPWMTRAGEQRDIKELLKGWVSRARMIRKLMHAGENIYVLRYEDLTLDFNKELSSLLYWLGLDRSKELIEKIRVATDFKNITGRERGTESKDIIRKGSIGEWIDLFSEDEKKEAWTLAGDLLSYFGYQENGGQQKFIHSEQRNLAICNHTDNHKDRSIEMSSAKFIKELPNNIGDEIQLSVPKLYRRGSLQNDEKKSIESAIRNIKGISLRTGIDNWSNQNILDFGCGVKIAQAIAQFNLDVGSYVGMDVFKELIDYMSSNVKAENIAFHHTPFYNEMYNRTGEKLTETSELPGQIKNYNLIILQSVFTHFEPSDFRSLLYVLRRYAADNARLIFTCFINNDIDGDFLDAVPERPLLKALYKEDFVRAMIKESGWKALSFHEPSYAMQHHFVCEPIS